MKRILRADSVDLIVQTINYLLMNTRLEVNALNTNGYTALDILAQSRRDTKDLDIADSLRSAGAFKAIEIQSSVNRNNNIGGVRSTAMAFVPQEQIKALPSGCVNLQQTFKKEDWLTRKRDSLMVVASLIATMAFQSGLNPPGGLWQDDSQANNNNNNNTGGEHQAGTSIMAYKYPSEYSQFLSYNTVGFIASLSIILLLITGLPFKRRFFMWVLIVIVWIAITSVALTYRVSILVFTPKQDERVVTRVMEYGVAGWCGVMALLLVGHTIRLTANFFKKVESLFGKRRRPYIYYYT